MKKRIKLLGLLLCFTVFSMILSCSKNDAKNEVSIVGDWECVKCELHSCYYDEEGGNLLYEKYSDYDYWVGKHWKLRDDGRFFEDGSAKGTYKLDENYLIIEDWNWEFKVISITDEKLILSDYMELYREVYGNEVPGHSGERVFYQSEDVMEFKKI